MADKFKRDGRMEKNTKFHENYKEIRKEMGKVFGQKSVSFFDLKQYTENDFFFTACSLDIIKSCTVHFVGNKFIICKANKKFTENQQEDIDAHEYTIERTQNQIEDCRKEIKRLERDIKTHIAELRELEKDYIMHNNMKYIKDNTRTTITIIKED